MDGGKEGGVSGGVSGSERDERKKDGAGNVGVSGGRQQTVAHTHNTHHNTAPKTHSNTPNTQYTRTHNAPPPPQRGNTHNAHASGGKVGCANCGDPQHLTCLFKGECGICGGKHKKNYCVKNAFVGKASTVKPQ
jgi:hypothetical protein